MILGVAVAGSIIDAAFYMLLLLSSSAAGVGWFVTAVIVANLIPPILLAPVLGWLVDRTSGRWVWSLGLFLSALACVVIATSETVAVLVGMAALQALASVAVSSSVFKLLPDAKGMSTNSASSFAVGTHSLASICGPPLAALGASTLTTDGTFAVLAILGALATAGAIGAAPRRRHAKVESTNWREAWLGAKSVGSMASIRIFAPVVLGIVLVTSMEGVAGVFWLQEVTQSSVGYGLILAVWAVGSFLGAVWTGRRDQPLGTRRSVILGGALMSGALLIEGLVPIAVIIGSVYVVGGFGNAVHNVGVRQLVYSRVPRHQHAQAWSMLAATMSATAAIGNALGTPGLIGEARTIVIISGIGGVLFVLISAALIMKREH